MGNETGQRVELSEGVTRVERPPANGRETFGDEIWDQLLEFAVLLETEGELRGLIGPRELERLWTRHILNSLPITEFVESGERLADVGSGAGFPGLVVAIVRPDVNVDLIEPMDRRTEWLQHASDELGLANVRIYRSRAEKMSTNYSADVVTARAVAVLRKLLPVTMPLVRSGGRLVVLKGIKAEQEIADASAQLDTFGADWADVYDVPVWGSEEGTRVVEIQKR